MILSHPSPGELHEFLLGKLPDQERAAIESHLGVCEQCIAEAGSGVHSDSLVELLAAAATQLDAERSAAATPVPLDTHSGVAGTRAWDDPDESGGGAAPPGIANHPRYKLLRRLGIGGMGSVWLAEHLLLNRVVAIKIIRPEFLAKPGAAERFRREARAVARLSHPNIVAAFDAEEAAGTHFLVMEYVAGENHGDVLRRGALPRAEACRAVRDAARGLAHAHACGLVHRDIKPHNLIRAADGATKILDFGLATAEAGSLEGLTGENIVLGTPDYIAPEQAQDARAADARSDIYSLGCTLFALLSGGAPYAGGTLLAKLDGHRHGAIPALSNVPEELAALVARMMAKRSEDRPTASDVAEALEPFCSSTAGGARTVGTPARDARRWQRAIVAGLLLAALGLAGGVVFKIWRDNQEITIETNDKDIKVVIRRNGELVRIVDTQTKQAWELDTKKLRLKPDGSELAIDLPGREPLVIRRHGGVVVVIRHEPPPPAVVEEIHRIPFENAWWHDFSVDGQEFLVYGPNSNKVAVIFDTATGEETGRFPLPPGTRVLTWFIPGSTDLLLSVDDRLARWDRQTGNKLTDLATVPRGSASNLVPLAADGSACCVFVEKYPTPDQNSIFVYDLKSGNERFRVKRLREGSILGMAPRFSPDGKVLATTDTTPTASAIRLWNAATGDLIQTIDVPAALGSGIEFSGSGREIVAAYFIGDAKWWIGKWNLDTREQLGKASITVGVPTEYSVIHPHGNVASFRRVGGTEVQFFDTRTGKLFAEYRPVESIKSSIASRDGRHVLYLTAADLRLVRAPIPDPPAPLGARRSAAPPTFGPAVATIEAYRVLLGHTKLIRQAIFSPDGKTVYSCGDDGFVRVWNVEEGRETARFDHNSRVVSIALADDGKTLLCVTNPLAANQSAARIWTWDVATGRESAPFPVTEGERLSHIAVNSDSKRAATVAINGSVCVWDIAGRKLLSAWNVNEPTAAYHIAWSPDDEQLAIAGDGLSLWNAGTGTLVHRLPPFPMGQTGSCFTPDGKQIFTGGWEGLMRVYDRLTWKLVREFKASKYTVGTVARSAVTADSRYWVGACFTEATVWDLTAGRQVARLSGHELSINSVAVSADGSLATSVSDDLTVRVWKLPK